MCVKSRLDVVKVLLGISLLSLINLSTQYVQVQITGPTDPIPVGDSVTLICQARLGSGDTLQDMAFDKDGVLPRGSTRNPQHITIASVKKSDAGHYKCSAVISGGGNDERFYTLQVTDIQAEIIGPTKPVPTGSNVTLKCHAKLKGNGRLQSMFFAKDGKSTNLSTEKLQMISIAPVQMHDGGKYTCSAYSTGSFDIKQYTLNVFVAPPRLEHTMFPKTTSLTYPRDDNFPTVAILFISGDNIGPFNFTAPPGMSLAIGTEQSKFNQIPTTNYQLVPIFKETRGEAGNSICEQLQRPSGLYRFWLLDHLINVTFRLDVKYRATWGGSSRNLSAYVGQTDVHITCDVCANPDVTYQWYLNLYPLNITSRTLTTETVGPRDFGVYQCTATNTIDGVSNSKTFSISLTEDRNKALDMGKKGIDDRPGSDAGGGSTSIPVYVYPIIASLVLVLVIAIAIIDRRRRKPKADSRKKEGNGPTVMYKKTPTLQTELQPSNLREPIYENGPANQRPQRSHVTNTTPEPTNKQELTYCQLDFDNHVSGRPEKEWCAPGPRAADEYTEYAEITGTLDRGKT